MPIPTGHTRFERKSLRETAADQIRAAIFDGTLQAGESLNDQDLQDWLGVSRTPIREALNDLARVGLIEMAPQRYTRVARPGQEDRLLVLQTLGALVGGLVRLTVPGMDEEGRGLVVHEIDETLALVEARDALGHMRGSWRLVDVFVGMCPNAVLITAMRDQIDGLAYRLSVSVEDGSTDWDALKDGYGRLREAVRGEDAVTAELAIEQVFQL